MSNKLINKLVSIIFVIAFVSLVITFGFNVMSTYRSVSDLDEFKKVISNSYLNSDSTDKDDSVKDNSGVSIEESSEDTLNKGELTNPEVNNVGTRYDVDTTYYNVEILNLDVLSKFIPTKGNELLEVYTTASNTLQDVLKRDTYCYIDESSIKFENSLVSFTLFDYSGDNKLANINVALYDIEKSKDDNLITEFKIDNLNVLEDYSNKNRDFLLYIYDTILNDVKKVDGKISNCYIDKYSVVKTESKLSFDVLNSKNNAKIKNVTIEL